MKDIGPLILEGYIGSALTLNVIDDGNIFLIGDILLEKSDFGTVQKSVLDLGSINTGLRLHLKMNQSVALFTHCSFNIDRFSLVGQNTLNERFRSINLGLGLSVNIKK